MATDRLSAGPAAKDQNPAAAGGPCILITGGAGYVGSHAVLELLKSGFRAVVLDNLVTGFRGAVHPCAAFVEGCVEDDMLVRRLLSDHDVRGILHCAGSTIARSPSAIPLNTIAITPQRADRFLRAPSQSWCTTSYIPRQRRYTALRDRVRCLSNPRCNPQPRTGGRSS